MTVNGRRRFVSNTGKRYYVIDMCKQYTRKEGRERLREYRENEPQYPVRLIKRRERKENVA